MTKCVMARAVAVATIALACGGCRLGAAREKSGGEGIDSQGARALATTEHASIGIQRMLYGQNLIHDPAVNQRMNDAVLQISRDGASKDSVMPEFYRWLEDWVATHPERVEAARRVGGGYSVEARRVYVDTDSSRKVQTDSIRRLVRDRARRRVEAARASYDSRRHPS